MMDGASEDGHHAQPDHGSWRALPRILYGFAIFPFAPIQEEDESLTNPHQVDLQLGAELYVFEVFRPTSTTSYSDEGLLWYRGYVVVSRQTTLPVPSTSTSSEQAPPPPLSSEEPSVTVGIFPASHTLIKERLEDGDPRLEELRQAVTLGDDAHANGARLEKLSLGLGKRNREPLAPLLEDENEGMEDEFFGTLAGSVNTPSKARNRASLSDARLSLLGGSPSRPSETEGGGHRRTRSSASQQSGRFTSADGAPDHRSSLAFREDDRPAPPLPSLKTGDETAAGLEEPLIDEIACALREYAALLHRALAQREYARLHALRAHIDALHLGRRQLLGRTLAIDELARLRAALVARLTRANIQNGLDIVVRHPRSGAMANTDAEPEPHVLAHAHAHGQGDGGHGDARAWMSDVRMYRTAVELAYSESSDPETRPILPHPPPGPSVLGRNDFDSPPSSARYTPDKPTPSPFYHIFIDLRALVASLCGPGETVELTFSLYNKSENRFLSEECCMVLNHQGVPRDGRLDKARVLFRDLSHQDTLDALLLVCRIIINGSFRTATSTNSSGAASITSRNSTLNGHLTSPYGVGSGYASQSFVSPVLPSTSALDLHNVDGRNVSQGGMGQARPSVSMTTTGEDGQRTFRRPFGCAVVEISQFCRDGAAASTSTSAGAGAGAAGSVELALPIFTPLQEAGFSTLHEDIIASRIKDFEKSPRAECVTVGLRVFHDDVQAIVRDNPSLMAETPLAARLGFPDVVFPDDQRNDVYIKLWSGDFSGLLSSGGKLARQAQANVEVEAEVRNREGSTVGYAISRGVGEQNVSRYSSMIFRNSTSPTWGELLRLDIPVDKMQECHLFFTLRNRRERQSSSGTISPGGSSPTNAEKPFAFGYLPLFGRDGAFLSDGSHRLILYRYEAQWAVPSTYFEGPSTSQGAATSLVPAALAKALVPLRDSVTVRSFLCSTRLTQDPTLLRIMDWERQIAGDPAQLEEALVKLRYSPEFECIKMITSVFDSLFAILASTRNEGGQYDDTVLQAVVTLLGLVNDRRFTNFRPVLDMYIESYFSSSTAFTHLVRSLHRLVDDFADSASAQNLRAAIKVWSHLFKIITRSRQLQRTKEASGMDVTANHLEGAFKRDIKALLTSVNILMSSSHPPSVIGTQTLAIQHFTGILDHLHHCFSSDELTDIAISFCDSVVASKSTMIVQKLLLQGQLASGSLMQSAGSRAILVPSMCRWLKPHLGAFDELRMFGNGDSEPARDAIRIGWLETTRLAVSVVAALLDKLHACVVQTEIRADRNALAQEHDNLEFVLSLLPRLLESYRDVQMPLYIQALNRHRSPASVVARTPTVFPSSYPVSLLTEAPPSAAVTAWPGLQNMVGEIAAVVIAMLHVPPSTILANYLQSTVEVEGLENTARLLGQLFRFGIAQLEHEAYPASWLSVSMLAHKCISRLAGPTANVLIRHYVPSQADAATFNTGLWRDFFGMLLRLLASPSLLIEDFSPARQRTVWRLAGDIRGEGSKVLLRSWEALSWTPRGNEHSSATVYGGYQVQLTNMVEPVLELCLSHHDELRSTAVKVLYSLIISEFHLNDSFHSIENEVLDRLDKLFSQRKGDEISRAFFITQLRSLFESSTMDERLREQVEAFLDSINHFLELLLGIRNLPDSEEWQDDRVIGTLKLMAFIEKRQRSLFIRYVHRLCEFHIASNQFTEAGLTLKLHADLYRFDTSCILPAMPELELPQQSEFGRKELLYLRILELLSKGKAFETAIAVSKELQHEYEQHVFAYQRLSELLTHQADLFAGIMMQTRHFAPCFIVGFFGRGFPVSVQNKQFVYRAYEWEKYGSFCERMQNKHPNAHLWRSGAIPPVEIQTSEDRYLLITPVLPEPDRSLPIFTNPDVPGPIRTYYENNETRTFSYTRLLDKTERTLTETAPEICQYTEKAYLTCAEAFPTILRRTDILESYLVELSPVESAIIDVRQKTEDLDLLHRRFITSMPAPSSPGSTDGAKINTNPLSMQLNACVDTGQSGGIALYRRAFFGANFIAGNPDKLELVTELRAAIDEHARTIANCMRLHEVVCPSDMSNFHATLIRFFERNFSEEISRMGAELDYKPAPAPIASPHRTSPSLAASPPVPQSPRTPQMASSVTIAGASHSRTFSSSTITSSSPHLPFALPPLSNIDEASPGSLRRNNIAAPLDRASSVYSTLASVPERTPNGPALTGVGMRQVGSSNGTVHFAPTPDLGKAAGRSASPAPSTVASTLNGTLRSNAASSSGNADRPSSFLSRFSSMRRKK